MVQGPEPAFDPHLLDQARIMVRDLDGTIRYWSRGLERLYGYRAKSVAGRKAQELLGTIHSCPREHIVEEIEKSGEWSGEVLNHKNDGSVIAVASHMALRRAHDGAAPRVVETNSEVERRSQDALYHAAIVQSTDDAIIGTTLDGIVTSWNPSAESLFQYSAAEMIGRSIETLLPPDRMREEATILGEVSRGNKITHFETIRLRKDGVEIAVSLTVSPIRLFDGTIVGASKIARDITERRNIEARVRQMQSELAHMGRLSEMGQMASALAHELNQPLTATNNYISAARHQVEAPNLSAERVLDALSKASSQIQRAGEVIRRLRGFLTKSGPERQVEPVERLIEDTAVLAHIDAKFRDASLRLAFDASGAQAVLDRVQFQQVLLNLLRNAFEATEGRDVRDVVIETRLQDGNVQISVTDSGPGLAPAVEENLFQPFVTTKQNGMGVGLSICRTIVEGFGGKIWYRRAPRGGAQFIFTVPLETP